MSQRDKGLCGGQLIGQIMDKASSRTPPGLVLQCHRLEYRVDAVIYTASSSRKDGKQRMFAACAPLFCQRADHAESC